MKVFIVLAVLAVSALALPVEQGVSLSQDTLGNYNLKVKTEDSARIEKGSQTGKVVGSYSFADKEGVVHTVKYIASDAGFKAEGDLPVSVRETPEVAAVRAAHLAAVKRERALLPVLKDESEEVQVFVPVRFSAPLTGRQILFAEAPKGKQLLFAASHHARQIAPSVPHQGVNFASKALAVDNTAEIEAAKAVHFAAHRQALAQLAEVYKKIESA